MLWEIIPRIGVYPRYGHQCNDDGQIFHVAETSPIGIH